MTAPTTPPTITPAPATPTRGSNNFATVADAFLAWLANFGSELVAIMANVAGNATAAHESATSATASAATAAGAANFKGAWSALTGALNIPASVTHAGSIWVLKQSVSDVTLETPGVSSAWVLNYPLQRLPIFGASNSTLSRKAVSSGETVTYSLGAAGIANPAYLVVLDPPTASFMLTVSSASTNQLYRQSIVGGGGPPGLVTLPSTGVWQVISSGTTFIAIKEGGSGSTSSASSTDGTTWTGFSSGLVWGSSLASLSAGGGGKMITRDSANANAVSTDHGATWTGAQTVPAASQTHSFVIAGLFVQFNNAGGVSTYYTSTTGLTGSWTSRTLPTGTDTIVQDLNGDLLAYKPGSYTVGVHRSVNGTTWTQVVNRLFNPAASIRSWGGLYFNGTKTSFATRGLAWVPRSATFDVGTTRHIVQGSESVNVLDGGLIHTLTDQDASNNPAIGLWE